MNRSILNRNGKLIAFFFALLLSIIFIFIYIGTTPLGTPAFIHAAAFLGIFYMIDLELEFNKGIRLITNDYTTKEIVHDFIKTILLYTNYICVTFQIIIYIGIFF